MMALKHLTEMGSVYVESAAATLEGLGAGWKDMLDFSPATEGRLAGRVPRAVQNAGVAVRSTLTAAPFVALASLAFGTNATIGDVAYLSALIGFGNASPILPAVNGAVEAIRSSLVSGYTFAKTKLGNY